MIELELTQDEAQVLYNLVYAERLNYAPLKSLSGDFKAYVRLLNALNKKLEKADHT